MGFDVLSYAIGLQAGKKAGGSSDKKIILAEQTFEGFVYSEEFETYVCNFDTNAPFSLTQNETYIIQWDGTVYECVAQDLSAMSAGMVAVGNLSPFGLSGNNEPFIINYVASSNGGGFLSFDTSTAHKVGIYQEAESGGDSGDTSKEYSIQEGSFAPTSKQMTVSHGGNKIPDIIIVSINDVPTANILFLAYGFSQAMLDKLGGGYLSKATSLAQTGGAMSVTGNVGMDKVSSTDIYSQYGGIRNVTDKTFTIGNTSAMGYLDTNESYCYTAIFGLT